MNPKYWLPVVLLGFPLLAEAQIFGVCQADLPTVEVERCNQPGYYRVYRARANKAINQAFDTQIQAIFADNRAHPNTIADETVINLASQLQCEVDVCNHYFTTCTSADIANVSSRQFSFSSDECLADAENNFFMAKNMAYVSAKLNAEFKARTTIFEKAMAIGYRYKTILFPIMDDARKELAALASKMKFLIEQPADVSGSKLQET